MVNAYACNRIQPNLETLQRIAEILQVDLKDLITDKKGKTTIEFKAISVVLDVFNLYKIENTLNVRILNSKIKNVVTTHNKARICQHKVKRHWKPD